jgi:GAF domain-containing protein
MNNRFKAQSTPESPLAAIRQQLLQVSLYLAFLLALIGVVISIPRVIQSNQWNFLPLILLFGVVVSGLTFYKRLSYPFRSAGLLVILVILSLVGLLRPELTFDGRIALITFITLANILRGPRAGMITSVLSASAVFGFAWVSSPLPVNDFSAHFSSGHLEWFGTGASYAFSAAIITASISFLQKSLAAKLDYEEKLTLQLKKQNETLAAQVQEQTGLSHQSAAQLSICWAVSHQFQIAEDAGQVLKKIIDIANSNLNFFYSGIFLVDDRHEYAVLEVATGDVGRTLVESNYRVNIYESNVIGRSIQNSSVEVISDTSTSSIFSPTPLISGTRAQAVIPIMKNKQTIGVLDVQSDSVHDFTSDEMQTLNWLSDQISLAVEIINLEKKIGSLKTEVDGIYRQMTQQNWRSHLKQGRRTYSYRYKQYSLEKNAPEGLEVAQVFKQGETIISSVESKSASGQAVTTATIPIKLRNQILGVLNIKLDTSRLPQDMIPVLEAASNRLAVALENARLLEEIQNKADREHMVSEISSKIRNSTNVDQVLRTTAAELGRTFGISEVLVQLRPSDPNPG